MALALVEHLHLNKRNFNIRGVVLGNGIISPALAMTKLGFYLEELGYIDAKGRDAIETLSGETTQLVGEDLENAFDKFISLGQFVNDNAGAVAVNLGNIVEKQTREPLTKGKSLIIRSTEEVTYFLSKCFSNECVSSLDFFFYYYTFHFSMFPDFFGQREYLRSVFKNTDVDIMNSAVAPALGISSNVIYDSGREAVIEAFRSSFMTPATNKGIIKVQFYLMCIPTLVNLELLNSSLGITLSSRLVGKFRKFVPSGWRLYPDPDVSRSEST